MVKAAVAYGKSNPLIGPILFIAFGLVLLAVGLYFYFKDSAALQWRSVKAEITKSSLKQLRPPRAGPSYTADVQYKYALDGKKYTGSCCDSGSGDYDRWKNIVDKNPVGSSADILIDPSDPSNSLLKDSIQPLNLLNMGLIVAGIIIVLLGSVGAYFTMTAK